jgi:predicted permease
MVLAAVSMAAQRWTTTAIHPSSVPFFSAKGVIFAAACPCVTASVMLASTYRIDEQQTTSGVVLSNIAGVFTMTMWIYVPGKIWA